MFVKFRYLLPMLLVSSFLCAAPKIAVLPIGANSDAKDDAAGEVFKKAKPALSAVNGVALDALSKQEKRAVADCEGEVSCMHRAVKQNGSDYYVIPVVAKYNEDDDEVTIELYFYDGNDAVKDSERIGPATPKKAAKMFASVIETFAAKAMKRESRRKEKEESSAKKSKKYRSGSEEIEALVADAEREQEEETPKDHAAKGYRAYREGDLKTAEQYFERAGKKNVKSKKIAEAIRDIAKKKRDADAFVEQKRFDDAIRVIEEIEKKDLGIRTLGHQEGAFSSEKRSRVLYEDPSRSDMEKVEKIHQKFVKKIAEARQAKLQKVAEVEKALNEKILIREKKIAQFVEEDKQQDLKEKETEAALKKRIGELRYKWEKEDSELEQQIVALESKLTMLEQKEKGVIKVSTEKRDKEKADEFAAVDKKYKEDRKKLDIERETFFNKQKDDLGKGGDKIEKDVAALSKQKKDKEDKIVEIDKKVQAELDEFDKSDKSKQGENESVKMKNEDEDRKFLVEVEKEYQKKFDELNQRLSEFDSKESLKKEDLAKFDKEIEEYMSKNAEEMGKIQEALEKERTDLEKAYNDKKAAAQTDFDTKYKAKLDELTAKKTELDAKLASWDADTDKMKQEKEVALTAENKAGDAKKELAKIDKDRKAEKAKLEKEQKKVTGDLAAHEKGKEEAQMNAIMAIDMEFEAKFADIDTRQVKDNDRLNKLNNDFRKRKTEEKKRYEESFQRFLKDKDAYRKNIEKLIESAQKERDAKIAKRKEDRERLAQGWAGDREKAKQALDRKQEPDRKMKERLAKEIEDITMKIEQINAKWAKDQEDLRVKQQEAADKFTASWKERSEALEKGYTEKKEAVVKKYEKIETDEKNANKDMKTKVEQEIDTLLKEKNRRKESRQTLLNTEKGTWEDQKKKWAADKEQRKVDLDKFKATSDEEIKAERMKIIDRKREIEKKYEDTIKAINDEETAQIQAQFKDVSKEVSKLEITPSKMTGDIEAMKADTLARQGLLYLQKEDLIASRRAFVNALYLDRENRTAIDGLKAIETSAKSMYWKAYGLRDTNKKDAQKILETLIKTLMPSSEYFIKAKTALEEIK